MAKKTDDGIVNLQGKLQVTIDESAAGKAKKSIDKIIHDLEKTPVKLAFDTSISEEFTRKLDKLKKQQDAVRQGSKANAEAELALINRQVKALEKLRDTSVSVNRARQGYGKAQQGLVGAGSKLSDRDITEMGRTARGRSKLDAISSASIARDELVGQSNRLARALFDAGMHDLAVQVKREADRVSSTGAGLSKRLSAGGQQRISAAIQTANKQISDAAIQQAEKIQQEITKAYLKAQRVRQVEQGRLNRIARGGQAFEAAGGLGGFDPSKVLSGPPSQAKAVKSYLGSQIKANEFDPAQVRAYQKSLDRLTDAQVSKAAQLADEKKKAQILYQAEKALMTKKEADAKEAAALEKKRADILFQAEKALMQKEHADRRQAQLDRARQLRTESGRQAFEAAGGLGGFDPGLIPSRSGRKSVQAYLGSEIKTRSELGDAEGVLKHQKALDKLTDAHKRMNPVLEQSGALMRQFFRYAIGYGGLYQVLGAVTALARGIVDLDKSLFDIQAITQSTSSEMIVLSGAINDVAINTKFSTAEIAEATKTLAQAGVLAKDIPEALRAVANFGAATGADLQVAADIMTTMQEVYEGLSADQASNQLTKAVNVSKLTAEDLKTIVSTGAQITASYGITSEQLLSAAATLRNAGIKSSTIATGLSQATLEVFTLDTKSLKGLFSQYHKLGEDLTEEQIKGMYAGFAQAEDPLLAVATELKRIGFGSDTSLNRIFDKRAINPLLALIDRLEEYRATQGELTFGQPAMEGAAVAMGSLSAQVDNLGSSLTALGAQITGGPVSAMKEFVTWATKGVEALRQFDLEQRAKEGTGVQDTVLNSMRLLPGVGNVIGAVQSYRRITADPNAELADKTAALQALSSQAADEVAKLEATRKAFDPEATGEHSLGETIHKIRDGLEGTDAQIKLAKDDLGGVAKAINDQVIQMADVIQSGGTGSEEMADRFAQIKEAVPQMYEIIRGVGEFSDPEKQLQGLIDIATAMREFSGSLQEISAAQSKAAEAATAVTESQVNQILSQEDSNKMSSQIQGFLLSVDALGVKAAGERLKILFDAINTALASATDPAQIASLQAQLSAVNAAVDLNVARGTAERTKFVSGLDPAALNDPAKIQAFMDSPEGRNLLTQRPGTASILTGGEAAAAALDLQANPRHLEYGPGGQLQPGADVSTPEGAKAQAAAETALAFTKWQQGVASRQKPPPPAPEYEPQTYIQSAANFQKVSDLDFEIEKIKEFGGASGQLIDLVNERNALMKSEQEKAVAIAAENAKNSGLDEDKKKYAEEQIKLQKMELDARKDYIDAVTKDTDTELKAYQDRAKTLLGQGGDLAPLDAEFKARQQDAINAITEWGKSVGMSDERIKAEIDSRGILSQSLLSDKVINERMKLRDITIAAAEKAIPTDPTTGNALLDAQSRVRGYGFTQAEMSNLYSRQIAGNQNKIGVLQSAISATEKDIPFSSPEEAERQRNAVEAYKKEIDSLTNSVYDLNVQISDIGTTGADQLKQAFGEESIRPYLIALEQSQSALKNWGANLRGSVLSAWEGIGDAIADSVVHGEKFSDLMENLAKNLAGDILRTSAKSALNTLARSVLGSALPGTEAQAGQPTAAGAPAAGGFLGSVASALGLGGGAGAAGVGSATGTMTVNAGVVNINGAAGAMQKTAEGMLGGGSEGKGLFKSITDGIGNVSSDAWKELKGVGSKAMSGIGSMASSAGSWISSLFAAEGWVGQFANGYVDKNGVIRGPGTGTSDSIPARMKFARGKSRPIQISNRESILTEKATNYLGRDTIGALNAGKIPGFSAGRVADQSARATSGVAQDQLAPVVHVPEFPAQTLEAYIGINASDVVTKGLRNNPGAVRELAEIQRVNRRTFNVTRN